MMTCVSVVKTPGLCQTIMYKQHSVRLFDCNSQSSQSVLFKVWPRLPDNNRSQRREAGSTLLLWNFPLSPKARLSYLHLLHTLCHQALCERHLPRPRSGQILPHITNANLLPDKNFSSHRERSRTHAWKSDVLHPDFHAYCANYCAPFTGTECLHCWRFI